MDSPKMHIIQYSTIYYYTDGNIKYFFHGLAGIIG